MTLGYIVECSRGGAMKLAKDHQSDKLLLYFSGVATVFPTRYQAQKAIANTRPTFKSEFGLLLIKRLAPPPKKVAR